MIMKVEVLAAATSKFGELWHISPRDLVRDVVKNTFTQANIGKNKISAVFIGNMLSGVLGGQEHLGAFFAQELGVSVPAMKIEGACASGGLAVHSAVMAILSGMYDTVLVVGVEKMTDHKMEDVTKALMGAGSDIERTAGATFPALYALMARVHMDKYGTTEEEMAAVSVKNHFHATLNPSAQFQSEITIEKVLQSPKVATPLKLLDCSPISDGASAILLTKHNSSSRSQRTVNKKSVFISASKVATDTLGLAERADYTEINSVVRASSEAYKQAGIVPSDVDIAEVHDCFSIAEIIAMEDLGFFPKGEAGKAILKGETTLDKGKIIVNTSGGLKACGHPVGATGVKQIAEIFAQLKGLAGKRQVKKIRVGLTHNVGGSGATAVIHILTT